MIFGRNDLKWDGDRLRLNSGRLLATVEPDQRWNGMWRVRLPGGYLSDMLLGLSISHDIIVKQHAGSIEVDTQPGSFTEFRIVLPRAGASLIKSGERM